jgi:hypothetical protein
VEPHPTIYSAREQKVQLTVAYRVLDAAGTQDQLVGEEPSVAAGLVRAIKAAGIRDVEVITKKGRAKAKSGGASNDDQGENGGSSQ